MKTIWIGRIPNIFGGSGISVASETKEAALAALRKEYAKRKLHSTFPPESTFEDHFEYFGGSVNMVNLDEAYNEDWSF
jgi:hypothetical protein